jgi:hypothetical protein
MDGGPNSFDRIWDRQIAEVVWSTMTAINKLIIVVLFISPT